MCRQTFLYNKVFLTAKTLSFPLVDNEIKASIWKKGGNSNELVLISVEAAEWNRLLTVSVGTPVSFILN